MLRKVNFSGFITIQLFFTTVSCVSVLVVLVIVLAYTFLLCVSVFLLL